MRDIGLSPEQLALVEDLVYAHQKKEIDFQATLEKLRLELNRMVLASPADDKKALLTVEKIGLTETESKKAHVSLLLGIKKIISVKQFDQFVSLSKNFVGRKKKE
jgi:hypothetical protein